VAASAPTTDRSVSSARDDHSGRLDITGPITEGRVLINAQIAAPLRLSKKLHSTAIVDRAHN